MKRPLRNGTNVPMKQSYCIKRNFCLFPHTLQLLHRPVAVALAAFCLTP